MILRKEQDKEPSGTKWTSMCGDAGDEHFTSTFTVEKD